MYSGQLVLTHLSDTTINISKAAELSILKHMQGIVACASLAMQRNGIAAISSYAVITASRMLNTRTDTASP